MRDNWVRGWIVAGAVAALAAVVPGTSRADDSEDVVTKFRLDGPAASAALESVYSEIPALLRSYTPSGGKVIRMGVSAGAEGRTNIDVVIEKTLGFVSLDIQMKGELVASELPGCGGSSRTLTLAFSQESTGVLVDNVAAIRVALCATARADGGLDIVARGSYVRGANWSVLIGPQLVKAAQEQVPGLVAAVQGQAERRQAVLAAQAVGQLAAATQGGAATGSCAP